MACSVLTSAGRADADQPSAGSPAAIAPDVTITAWCPVPRTSAISPASFSMDATAISPCSSVIDDVPTFTTAIIERGRSRRDGVVGLVLEDHVADADDVAGPRPRPAQRSVDAQPAQPVPDVGGGFRVGQ